MVSTDGNISDIDRLEERQTIGMVQKSALGIFGPNEKKKFGGFSSEDGNSTITDNLSKS